MNYVDPFGLSTVAGQSNVGAGSPGSVWTFITNNPQQIVMGGDVGNLIGTQPRPGQVYLFTHGDLAPIIGGISPGGSYGHAAIEIGPDSQTGERRVYSAAGGGTYIQTLGAELRGRSGVIYAPRGSVDPRAMDRYAQENVGTPYDWVNLIGPDIQGREICSSAVAQCLTAGGIHLQHHGSQISPNDLARDPALSRIGEFRYDGWELDAEDHRNRVQAPLYMNPPKEFILLPRGGL